jgi:hypothetical protein
MLILWPQCDTPVTKTQHPTRQYIRTVTEQYATREHYCGRSAHQGRGVGGRRSLRRLDQPNFSLAVTVWGLAGLPCLALPKQPAWAWTNYSSDEWICFPFPFPAAGMIDAMPSAVTGPPDGSRGACGFVLVMCAWCVVYGWPVRVRALEAVALAWLLEPNPQRLLRFLSHSPFLPTFSHFAVCVATVQIAFASISPFSPSPTPLNRLISGISVSLDNIPTSNSPSAPVCKQ